MYILIINVNLTCLVKQQAQLKSELHKQENLHTFRALPARHQFLYFVRIL